MLAHQSAFGFANFGRLGILIAGMTSMVPEQRDEIVALGRASAGDVDAHPPRRGHRARFAPPLPRCPDRGRLS